MKELHVVGFTADRDGLVLTARRGSASGGYKIRVDDALVDHIDELRAERGDAAPRLTRRRGPADRTGPSALSPREIQARLRAGRSVAEVAAEAGADTSWIERFAGPILAEQANAVDRAVRLPLTTATGRTASLPLADAVAANLAGRGSSVTEGGTTDGWSACRLHGSTWRVRYTFRQGGRQVQAEWSADLAAGTVAPANPVGADLGVVPPEGSAARQESVAPEDESVAPEDSAAREAPVAADDAGRKAPANKAPAKRSAAQRSAAQRSAVQAQAAAKTAAKRQADQERAAARQAVMEERDRQRKADLAAKAVAKKEAAAAKAAAKKAAAEARAVARERARKAAADRREEARGAPNPGSDQLAFEDLASAPDPLKEMAELRNGVRRSGQDP